MRTAYQTKTEKILNRGKNDTIVYKTHLKFVEQHNGWRDGNVHTFLGEAGAGKSTLTRTLLLDLVSANDKKVLIWLSEESVDDFLTEFHRSEYWNDEKTYNIKLISEIDEGIVDEQQAMVAINGIVQDEKIDLIFYDNLTTSCCHDGRTPGEQSKFARRLKQMAEYFKIPLVVFAHTNGQNNTGRMLEMNDIRGAKTIVNISQFFYIMQTFYFTNGEKDDRFNTMRITKNRGQDVKDRLYRLDYNPDNRTYSEVIPIPFAAFKEVYDRRHRL